MATTGLTRSRKKNGSGQAVLGKQLGVRHPSPVAPSTRSTAATEAGYMYTLANRAHSTSGARCTRSVVHAAAKRRETTKQGHQCLAPNAHAFAGPSHVNVAARVLTQ